MKKSLMFCAAFAMVGGLMSPASAGYRIGVTYQNLQNEFIVNIAKAVEEKAKELDVTLIESDGQGKAEVQISQVENFIAQHVDAILLIPFDKEGCAPAVQKAVAAKIPLVVFNAQVANVELANTYVGSDDIEAGRIEMQYIADLLGGRGNIAIIHGPNGHSAEVQRTEGNKQVLENYPDIKVLFEQTANWDRAQALSLTENWLQTGRPLNAIVAQNDEMALGAYKAVEAAGKAKDIPVIGVDAIADALKSVKDGKMAATVFQDAHGQGATAVEMAVKILNGEEVPKVVNIPFKLITKENVDSLK
ncbi:ABC transporter substrate binding protein [Pleomorphomonas koreensis]|uniref:ABC transporter substrate binding protein n=1 Tax=Pleomorphomonas koreensis TaxID=257440 RepID=UPI0004014A01|nr:ABC transporter substrate binding protein [Pleomorphomonas koreensis]